MFGGLGRATRAAAIVGFAATALPAASPAAADPCAPGGARNLQLVKVDDDLGFLYIQVKWDPPSSFPVCPPLVIAGAHVVETRDVTTNSVWEFTQVGSFGPDYAGSMDPGRIVDVYHAAGALLTPGDEYEVRVHYQYTWNTVPPDAPQYVVFDSPALSVTADATVNHDAPSPPKGVEALADPKLPRVTVSWAPPEKQPPAGATYSVRRRVVPPADAKDDSAFEVIADGGPVDLTTLRKFIDRKVLPDTEYEYVVAIIADQAVVALSPPDSAFVAGKCPASKFQIWDGQWNGAGAFYKFATADTLDGGYFAQNELPAFRILAPTRLGSLPTAALRGYVDADTELGYPKDTRVAVALAADHADPFSATAWRRASATFTVGKKNPTTETGTFDRVAGGATTTVCATIASGAGKLKGGVARPGDNVAFTVNLVALGPQPLFANQLRVQADVEGGTIAAAVSGASMRTVADPAGTTQALFDVGALGPKGVGRSEVAAFTLVVTADDVPADGQLRCVVKLVPLSNGEDVKTPIPTRFSEVKVVAASDAAH